MGEYQIGLNPPKNIALYCKEIDNFQNEIDSQLSQLFAQNLDGNYAVHYTHFNIYLPLSSCSPLHSLHLTLLDKNQKTVIPKTFNLVLLYTNKHECLR